MNASDAAAQQCRPEDLVAEAVRANLEALKWRQFVENNERRARARGISEVDVERLVDEVRRENKGCEY